MGNKCDDGPIIALAVSANPKNLFRLEKYQTYTSDVNLEWG